MRVANVRPLAGNGRPGYLRNVSTRGMAPMRRALVALFAVSLPCAVTAQLADADVVDRYVQWEMERQHIVGLAVAVVKGGRVAHATGFGFADRERKIAITPSTVFKIGSVSKQFLA